MISRLMEIDAGIGIVLVCAAAIFIIFLGYPILLLIHAQIHRRSPLPQEQTGPWPSVTLLVVVHDAADSVEAKLRNSLAMHYPTDRLRVLLCSDGSGDGTAERAAAIAAPRVTLLSWPEFRGKNRVINDAVVGIDADLLVFSDVDAMLPPDALQQLVLPFNDPGIGGVCGNKQIRGPVDDLGVAQCRYNHFAGYLKQLESLGGGSITSNDGKLYAIRRPLFRALPAAVTDDLYNCLRVVSQGYRFVYQPFAIALIPTPSMDSAREIARRRRIVARSLNGIRLMGSLLNPLRHGRFAVGLFVNKLLRRMLPLFLVLLLIATAMEAVDHPWILALGLLQLGLYSLAAIHPLLGEHSRLRPASGLAYYFCLGNYATLLGLLDYLRGRRPERWETRRAALSDSDVRSSVNVWRNSRR